MTLPPLYPILDTTTLERRGLGLVEAAEAMIEGGARILQLRHKGHFHRSLFADAESLAGLCEQAGVSYIIDDRADIARLVGAGLHVGQEDLPPAMARQLIGATPTLGFSTHNAGQLRAAEEEPVDYLAVGPIFSTGSKDRPDPVVGTANLRQWRSLTERPLVAIGGITRENALEVLAAGADSVAVIGDLYPARLNRASLRRRITEWQTLIANK
jgi:thiamine-phosphate pyrophosphorylase